jgi:hypothetical protein
LVAISPSAELAADDEKAVGGRDEIVRDPRVAAEEPGRERMHAGDRPLSGERVRDRGAEHLCEPEERPVRTREMGAAAGEDHRPLRLPEHRRGAADVIRRRAGAPRRGAQGRRLEIELVAGEVVLAMRHVLRHVEHDGAGAAGGGDGESATHELGHAARQLDADQLLHRRTEDFDLARLLGHVLPGMGAMRVASDRDHGHAGVQRLDERGDEVGGARSERAVADARPVGDAGPCVRREGAAALVIDEEVLQPELRHRVVEREELEAAHPEHRPNLGEAEHLGEGAPAGHRAGGAVGKTHGCFSRMRVTNCLAVMPTVIPSAAAVSLTAEMMPSS